MGIKEDLKIHLTKEDISCVLLAGGRGKRMGGVNKAALPLGEESFAEHILGELKKTELPCCVSAAHYHWEAESFSGCELICDDITDRNGAFIGPLGGIVSCLRKLQKEAVLVTPCDMPGFRYVLAETLLKEAEAHPEYDAIIWETRDGRVHPGCGIYRSSCLEAAEDMILEENYKMQELLKRIRTKILKTSIEHVPDKWFQNINDPESLQKLQQEKPAILAVSGTKNTGKTTFLENAVRELSARGIRTAVIKHDGHDFEPDVPGTDSYRMKKAGAVGTVVYSKHRYCLVKDETADGPSAFFELFQDADLILLEGQKYSDYPKIEVMRACISREPVCDPDTVLAYAADWITDEESGLIREGKTWLSFNDTDNILETILRSME